MEVENRPRRKCIGMWSRHFETEAKGNGWYRRGHSEAKLLVIPMREKVVGRGKQERATQMMKKDGKSTWTECRTGYIRIIPENDAKNNGAEPEKKSQCAR